MARDVRRRDRGFVVGVNAAGAKVYKTDVGKVRISIRLDYPGNVVRVSVPQARLRRDPAPVRAPIEWRARTVTLNRHGHALAGNRKPLALGRAVLNGKNAVVPGRPLLLLGAGGALIGAVAVALLFTAFFGGLISRLLIAVFAVAPLLTAGGVAFLIAGSGRDRPTRRGGTARGLALGQRQRANDGGQLAGDHVRPVQVAAAPRPLLPRCAPRAARSPRRRPRSAPSAASPSPPRAGSRPRRASAPGSETSTWCASSVSITRRVSGYSVSR